MIKISKNEKGFSTVELVLALVILILIVVVGWLVYKNNHKTTSISSTTASTTKPTTSKINTTTTTQSASLYAGWKTSTLQYERITYQYPSNWTVTDNSAASPKSQNGCTYPGHDLITLNSPSGTEVAFNAGQDCFGYPGDTSFGSVPIDSLGQKLYLAFEASNYDSTLTSPNYACLARSPSPNGQFDFKSRNIYDDPDSFSAPENSFCYIPYNPSNYQTTDPPSFTIAQIEATPDYNTAKLIFESMHY